MKNLFKTVIFIVLFSTITKATAQISIGPGIAYGTEINNIGLSLNGKFEINEKFAIAPSFTYFLKKDFVTLSSLGINANYEITKIENTGILYGIGGLGVTFWSIDGRGFIEKEYGFQIPAGPFSQGYDANTTEIALNLGVGLNIFAGEKMNIAPEIMYTFGDIEYLTIGTKILFDL